MVKQPTQELAKRSPSEVVPSYLADLPQGEGFEEMTGEDQLIPRLQIAQPLAPQLVKSDPSHIEGLSLGEMFNSISGKNYGDEVVFVPLFFFHSALNIQDGKVVCMSKDARTCPLYKTCRCEEWKEGKTLRERKPECQKLLNYAVWIVGANEVASLSLKSTGIKVAKKWNSLQKMLTQVNTPTGLKRLPMYSRTYKATSYEDKNDAGQRYYQWRFHDQGWTDEGLAKMFSPVIEGLRGRVVVDPSGLSGGGREPGAEGDEEF